jgi:hypothetical protein
MGIYYIKTVLLRYFSQNIAYHIEIVRFCKLAGCIVVNYSENGRFKVILEEYS